MDKIAIIDLMYR